MKFFILFFFNYRGIIAILKKIMSFVTHGSLKYRDSSDLLTYSKYETAYLSFSMQCVLTVFLNSLDKVVSYVKLTFSIMKGVITL